MKVDRFSTKFHEKITFKLLTVLKRFFFCEIITRIPNSVYYIQWFCCGMRVHCLSCGSLVSGLNVRKEQSFNTNEDSTTTTNCQKQPTHICRGNDQGYGSLWAHPVDTCSQEAMQVWQWIYVFVLMTPSLTWILCKIFSKSSNWLEFMRHFLGRTALGRGKGSKCYQEVMQVWHNECMYAFLLHKN